MLPSCAESYEYSSVQCMDNVDATNMLVGVQVFNLDCMRRIRPIPRTFGLEAEGLTIAFGK